PHPPKDALDRIPATALRSSPPALPELNEPEVVRHFVNLSQLNYAIDTGFYPLGSCTMKFNPKLNEWAARLPGFASLHPLAPAEAAPLPGSRSPPPVGRGRAAPGHPPPLVGPGGGVAQNRGQPRGPPPPARGS